MSDFINKPINPFLAARRPAGVRVALEIHNVQEHRPDWNEVQAESFLDRHAATIAHTMLVAGEKVIRQILEQDKHDC